MPFAIRSVPTIFTSKFGSFNSVIILLIFVFVSNVDTLWSSPTSIPLSHKKHRLMSSFWRLQRGVVSLSATSVFRLFFARSNLQLLHFARQDLCHDVRWNAKFSEDWSFPKVTINGKAPMARNSSTFFRKASYASELFLFWAGLSRGI